MSDLLRDQGVQTRAWPTFETGLPGPILHDFGAVLDYIGTEGVEANGKHNFLPMNAIPILDERLTRPLRLRLQRPQLKSHPYLLAIHLLLRATGLTSVVKIGKSSRLVVNPNLLEQWHLLNPTEQYFNLLEAAFVHSVPEMIGQRDSFGNALSNCVQVWQRLPSEGVRFTSKKTIYLYWITRQSHLVALVDLFGLMTIGHPSVPVHPWVPTSLGHTPFGDAFFDTVQQHDLVMGTFEIQDQAKGRIGFLQPYFQPHYPQWRENLRPAEPEYHEGVFHFKVSLGNIWREIAVPDETTLHGFAYAILDAVDFDHDHLYEFTYRDPQGRTVRAAHPECDDGLDASDIAIGKLSLAPGNTMTFLFDFGDNWTFDIVLEKIAPSKPAMKKPKVVAERGDAPEQYPDSEQW